MSINQSPTDVIICVDCKAEIRQGEQYARWMNDPSDEGILLCEKCTQTRRENERSK